MKNDPVKVEGIDHIVLRVTDIQRSLHFYLDVLGLRLERIVEDVKIYQVRCGRNIIDLVVMASGSVLPDKSQRSMDHLCLIVDGDIDEILGHLRENDVPLASPVRELYGATGFGTSVYILDPDSHMIELKTKYCQYPVKTTAADALRTLTRP